MAALRALLACLVLAALASGCVSDLSGSEPTAGGTQQAEAPYAPPPEDPQQADEPTGGDAGTPAGHGTPRRTDGSVDVRPEGTQYVATRVITVENDFGGAQRSHLVLSTFNGAVAIQPSQGGGYLFTAELYGRGATEQDARQALDLLELQATDGLDAGGLDLSFTLTARSPAPLPLPVALPSGVTHGAAFKLGVPAEPAHDIEAGTSNGAVAAAGLHGPLLDAGSTNGAISVDGAWDRIEAATTNGAISLGGGTINDVTAQTSNGAISASLDPSRTATAKLTTNNGAISVELPREAGTAFDIQADTTNGRVSIEVEDHDSVDDDHGEYRSPGWTSADVQLTLDLDTTNGSVSVED